MGEIVKTAAPNKFYRHGQWSPAHQDHQWPGAGRPAGSPVRRAAGRRARDHWREDVLFIPAGAGM